MQWPSRALRPVARRVIVSSRHCRRRFQTSTGRPWSLQSAADLQFGQPVHETHPHILELGQITPGITALEYAERRRKLSNLLPQNSVAIIPSADVKYRSGAVFYDFHQDPDFFYLTGFNEPEALAVIEKKSSDAIFHLFVRPKDRKAEQWEGTRSGIQAALDVFNADEAADINKVERSLPSILKGCSKIYTDLPRSYQHNNSFSRYLSGAPSRASHGIAKTFNDAGRQDSIEPLRPLMNKLRVKKSEAEIITMRKVGQASGRAFTKAMRRSFEREKDLGAMLDYNFKLNGCDGSAYVPVIAGGKNALSIHYVRNDDVLEPDSMILVDAGGELGGYITDITRTWPNNGRFSPAQKDLYTAILDVQRKCIALCRQNAHMSLDKIHATAEKHLRENVRDLGFDMSGSSLDVLFPHHLGHYIGLDVHDCTGYPRTDNLESGHCITIEPGIYVPDDDRWPTHFRGMGIRIEDSVCVREESVLVFTTEAVKEVVDIEALRH